MSEAQQIYEQQRVLEQLLMRLAGDEQRIRASMVEAMGAIDAIRSIKDGGDCQTLLQIGYGAMLKARVSSNDLIPVSVGSGVVVEKSPDSAINYLEARIKELTVSLNNTVAGRSEIMSKMEQGNRRLEDLARSAQSASRN